MPNNELLIQLEGQLTVTWGKVFFMRLNIFLWDCRSPMVRGSLAPSFVLPFDLSCRLFSSRTVFTWRWRKQFMSHLSFIHLRVWAWQGYNTVLIAKNWTLISDSNSWLNSSSLSCKCFFTSFPPRIAASTETASSSLRSTSLLCLRDTTRRGVSYKTCKPIIDFSRHTNQHFFLRQLALRA